MKSSLTGAVPELPVADVELAQKYYRDTFDFKIGWLYPDKGIGAVSRDNMVIFLRKRERPFEPAVHWIFVEDVDESYQEFKVLGANITDDLEVKPWGIKQFTLEDLDGNIFYIYHG